MANIFKRATKDAIGTSLTTVYTCPNTTPDTTTVIIGGVISNTGTTAVNAEVAIVIGSTTINLIGKDTPIPAGTALSFIDGKVVMQEGDILKAKGSVAGQLDIILSIMEAS
jgi:hypothetical protein